MESELLNQIGANRLIKICLIIIGTLVVGLIACYIALNVKVKDSIFKESNVEILREEFTPKCFDNGYIIYEATFYYKQKDSNRYFVDRYEILFRNFDIEYCKSIYRNCLEW